MTKQKHFYLLRGLIRESRHWYTFPSLLKAQFPDAEITMIDIPGAGVFYQDPSPLSMKAMVEQMRRVFVKAQRPGEEAILVAISLGGMISAQWLKDFPQDFHRAVLINTSYGGISPLFHRLKPEAILYLSKVFRLKGREKEAHILKLVSNHPEMFDENLDHWEKIQSERPVSVKNTIRQVIAGALFKIGNFKPTLPILLLASTHDRMVSVECSREIARQWKVPLIEHPTGGHDLSVDDSPWVVQRIKEFVRS